MSRTEFDRIARLTARFGAPPPPDLGIGDDAAVLHPRGALVATVDASVEDVHFRRSFAPLDALAARAVEAAASDVAAMGASFAGLGAGLLLSWSLPPWVDDAAFEALVEGSRRAAERLGARVLGGNLTGGAALALHTTALANLLRAPVTRAGASPGDRVFVSGPLGGAAVGLRALLAGREGEFGPFVARWRAPRARTDLARDVSRCTAAIDLSDGFAQDALHLARASGVALEIARARLPCMPGQAAAAALLGVDPRQNALSGGEDYELCVTSRTPLAAERWVEVGAVVAGEGLWLIEASGERVRWDAVGGWDHFRPGETTSR